LQSTSGLQETTVKETMKKALDTLGFGIARKHKHPDIAIGGRLTKPS
jgi:hypothetical protein